MNQYVTLTIDGSKVRTPKGSSVLDAAILYGICIPHLCYLPTISEIGSCRLCIVENVVNGKSRITTSCTLVAQEGMVIEANSEKVLHLRRNIAELLVAQAPNSRALQDIAVRCGVTDVRYPFRQDDCVLCGRCVRVCREMYQAHAIGFVDRGDRRQVDFPFSERPEFCKQCWACVDLCPMKETPCDGPMKPGEEYFCGKCESTVGVPQYNPGDCVRCDMGKGFDCVRHKM
jgi:NADH dehydrogenase/NADH:ubiquinone oxidoreductase subunit G